MHVHTSKSVAFATGLVQDNSYLLQNYNLCFIMNILYFEKNGIKINEYDYNQV